LPWLVAIYWLGRSPLCAGGRGRSKLFQIAFDVSLVAVVSMFSMHYFMVSRQARYGMKGNDFPKEQSTWIEKEHHVTMAPATQFKLYMIVKYWAGGYKGLSECLKLPYESCYGVGHSALLARYAGKFNPQNPGFLYDKSYPVRAEAASGYSASGSWHTIYPWLASDLTFPGAILFIGLMGFLLARSWNDSLGAQNPFAIAFFCQVLLMFYNIPCNNIRLGYSEEMISFWALLVLWPLTSARIPQRGQAEPVAFAAVLQHQPSPREVAETC
jgi:hypothetical protein